MEKVWPTVFTQEVAQALLAPFPLHEISTRPVRNNKVAYIDARAVQGRLDSVVGPGNWEFDFEVIHADPTGVMIKGRLEVLGCTKCEMGEHWRAGDKDTVEMGKSAVSDALKRCAVHFGIGRFLYYMGEGSGNPTVQVVAQAAREAGYLSADAPSAPAPGGPRAVNNSSRTPPSEEPNWDATQPVPNRDTEILCQAGCGQYLSADELKAAHKYCEEFDGKCYCTTCGIPIYKASKQAKLQV